MPMSLQDQLLKAGLTDKKSAQKVKREKHKKAKHQQKHKIVEVDENKAAAQQARQQKLEKDRELNQQTRVEAEKKAIAAQVKQLIELNRQPKNNGEVVCNFTDASKIKRLFVDQATQNRISAGKLAIVKLADNYEIVPMLVADKIAERDEASVIYRADVLEQTQDVAEEDDWYADYQIPDDLTW